LRVCPNPLRHRRFHSSNGLELSVRLKYDSFASRIGSTRWWGQIVAGVLEPFRSEGHKVNCKTKFLASLSFLGLLAGCSGGWRDTGEHGPWCAPNKRARVFYRTVASVAGPQQGEVSYENNSGVKKSKLSFGHELDEYFGQCAFINQWPQHGTVNSVSQHEPPFDLCLVAMDPTVIVGVERRNPKVSALDSPAKKAYVFVGSTHLLGFVEARTTLPYYKGAEVVWFSPEEDHELHRLDLGAGTASFTVGKVARITVAIEGPLLATSRELADARREVRQAP
jgi:hypothetical protein